MKAPVFLALCMVIYSSHAVSFTPSTISATVFQEDGGDRLDFSFHGGWTDSQTFSAVTPEWNFTLSWADPRPAMNDCRWVDYTFDVHSRLGDFTWVLDAPDTFGMGGVQFGSLLDTEEVRLYIDQLISDDAMQTISGEIRLKCGAVPESSTLPGLAVMAALFLVHRLWQWNRAVSLRVSPGGSN